MRVGIGLSLMLALGFCAVVRADDEAKKERPQRGEDFRARMIEKFDKDGDGKLSDAEKADARAEFEKHRGEGRPGPGGFDRKAMLEKFDEDKSGDLNEKERAALRKHFEELRAKGGEGGRPAFGGPGRPGFDREALIKEFDKDGDGQLSDSEKEAAHAAMRERFEKRRAEGGQPLRRPARDGEGRRRPQGDKPADKE